MDMTVLALGIKDIEVADYHYQFYNALAGVVADRWPEECRSGFYRTIREELSAEIHGEVDEKSWHLKQALLRRQTNVRKETKLFREYARQAFEDTLTLYLHGTCCDIDVETGPRQMPSRYLRRRLELLISLYPPPEGYAVLPGAARRRGRLLRPTRPHQLGKNPRGHLLCRALPSRRPDPHRTDIPPRSAQAASRPRVYCRSRSGPGGYSGALWPMPPG